MERASSGSDWSDVDEVPTARFSQEEPVSLRPSAVPEASAFPAACVMYPAHLYLLLSQGISGSLPLEAENTESLSHTYF